ncbi:MAG: hypothetical protein ABIJ65_00745 [Chloroflexota bacterium]
MTVDIDLNFLPFHRIKGKDRPSLPGLMTVAPPQRAARGREGDHLFIYLTLAGNKPFSLDEYTKIISQMTGSFYATSGSLTAALRTTADLLNQTLLNRNLSTTGQGHYIVGRLVLGVLRGSRLVVVQSGPTHIFCVGKKEVEHLHDPEISGRGLGFSQTTTLYYSQLMLNPGDQLVVCAQLPDGWDTALINERGGTSIEALYRKLQAISNENINAVIIQVQAGKGLLKTLSADRQPPAATLQGTPVSSQEPLPGEKPVMEDTYAQDGQSTQNLDMPTEPVSSALDEFENSHVSDQVDQAAEPVVENSTISSHLPKGLSLEETPMVADLPGSQLDGSAAVSPEFREYGQSRLFDKNNTNEIPEIKRLGSSRRTALLGKLLVALQSVRKFGSSLSTAFPIMLKKLLPGAPGDPSPIMPRSSMAFIAIIVPLAMVVIASTVYIKFGQSAQYDENYKLAINEAVGAIGQSDVAIVRRAWESTLYYLDRADAYQITQESNNLRQQAQSALDAMDQIIRLDFRPAIIGGLAKTIQIGRMAASETDLYMLNVPQGNVIRAFMTSQGYEVDGNFICGPGNYASMDDDSNLTYEVGGILDMFALPRLNGFGATLMGLDATGNLLFCSPNNEPKAWRLEEPDIRWKNLVAFSVADQVNSLYVLDPAGNAIWEFNQDENGQYTQAPELFFSGGFVPQNLTQAIDISISQTDIYLLFDDGHVTHCTPGFVDGSGETVIPIRCNDPEVMTDTRSGYHSGVVLSDAKFSEFTFISSSDPSLYMLAPSTAAIFRFSPRPETLFLQNQFRAAVNQEKALFTSPISAMAISPNRYIFLSAGSQVYLATDVP